MPPVAELDGVIMDKKFIVPIFLFFFFTNVFAKSPIDTYLGKWAMPEYGCNDEDGQGAIYIDKEKNKYTFEGDEEFYTLTKIEDTGTNVNGFPVVTAYGITDGRYDGINTKFTFNYKKLETKNEIEYALCKSHSKIEPDDGVK